MRPGRRAGKAAFVFVLVTAALDMLALGIIIPVLPPLIVRLSGGNVASAAAVAGLFAFVWSAMQFFFSPILGALSDRFGRRPIILLSNLGLGLDGLLMAVAPSLRWLFVGRLISGLTSASVPTASAYIADVTEPHERAASFGYLSAAIGVGFVVGPAVGGLLGALHPRLPFAVSAAMSLANWAYGFFVLPESLPPERRRSFEWKGMQPFGWVSLLRSSPALLGLATAAFLSYAAHESLPSVFVFYTDHRYGWNPIQEGMVLAAVGICWAAVSAWLVGPSTRRFGERGTMLAGLAFGVVGFLAYAAAPTSAAFLGGVPFIALWALATPSMQALLTREVGADEQGRLQGALGGLKGITGMAGPIFFTQIFSRAVSNGATTGLGLPYFFAAVLLFGSLAWSWRASRACETAEAAP